MGKTTIIDIFITKLQLHNYLINMTVDGSHYFLLLNEMCLRVIAIFSNHKLQYHPMMYIPITIFTGISLVICMCITFIYVGMS
jgi:hypothetical protein